MAIRSAREADSQTDISPPDIIHHAGDGNRQHPDHDRNRYAQVRDRLVLVRDRFGIKPLYFARRGDALYWGSEVKAILAHPEVPARLDPRAVLHQLMQTMVPGTTRRASAHRAWRLRSPASPRKNPAGDGDSSMTFW